MHINQDAYPNAKRDMIHRPSAAQVKKYGSLNAARSATASGPKTVAVILVQFPASTCGGCTSGSNLIQDLTKVDGYFDQMAAYFDEVSYHKISLSFKFFGGMTPVLTPLGSPSALAAGAYTLNQRMEYYGCGDEGVGCAGVVTPSASPAANGDTLIAHALSKARAATGGPTSKASAGIFDAVIVMHAGNGNETTLATAGDIWSIFYSQAPVITSGGGGFDEGDVVPETEASGITSPLGVMCHEFGHELGLPDLYNTSVNGGTSVVGNWDLMDSGPFVGAGANPSHLGAWAKVALQWATPQTITSRGTLSLPFIETDPTGVARINTPSGLPQEYFLVEHRSRSATGTSGYDHAIPGDGLLIWHVDDELTASRGIAVADVNLQNKVNAQQGVSHYGVSIVTADGVTIGGSNQGNAGNAFTNGHIFTSPQSNNFSGEPSGVTIVNISGVGTSRVSADVAALAVSANQRISKWINYPNPAGKGYSHPNGDGHTTVQFQLTRPAQDYAINLYTLSADLVRKVGKDGITLNITRSEDLKWVYEYVWDLTNGDGAHVAPGVYLYLIRADGESKSGKAVIIR